MIACKQNWIRLRHEAIGAKTSVARQQLGLSHHLLRVLLVVGLLTIIIAAVFPGSPFRSAVAHTAGIVGTDCGDSIPWKDFNIDSYQGTDTATGTDYKYDLQLQFRKCNMEALSKK